MKTTTYKCNQCEQELPGETALCANIAQVGLTSDFKDGFVIRVFIYSKFANEAEFHFCGKQHLFQYITGCLENE